jgi:DNA-binding GntR family transcriptional regulator
MSRRYSQDPDVPRPQYQRVSDDLREQIDAGTLGPGAQIPTEKELTKQYGVSRETVRRGLDVLRAEGRIIGRPPIGVFVRSRTPMVHRPQAEFEPAPSAEMDRWMGQIVAEGRLPEQSIAVEVLKPAEVPTVVAAELRTGDKVVVVRRRIRHIDGEPYYTNDSYFLHELVGGSEILLPHDITRGANEVLAELGAAQLRAIDRLKARMPTPKEAERLELPTGTPIFYKVTTGFDATGRPVRCVIDIMPGDRNELVYERTRPE